MSLNAREIGQIVGFARAVIEDVDAAVAVSGGGANGTLLFVDLTKVNAAGYTRAGVAALLNRAMQELEEVGTPPDLSA
jgi:hypothetical protein